jgi:hypothetical protein
MRRRPKEIKALVNLLSQEHDDVESLAGQVWDMLDETRLKRELYVVGMRDPSGATYLFGTYDTRNAADKALQRAVDGNSDTIFAASEGTVGKIFRILTEEEAYR